MEEREEGEERVKRGKGEESKGEETKRKGRESKRGRDGDIRVPRELLL